MGEAEGRLPAGSDVGAKVIVAAEAAALSSGWRRCRDRSRWMWNGQRSGYVDRVSHAVGDLVRAAFADAGGHDGDRD